MPSDFIGKDKCNHIAPVPAQLWPHSPTIESSSRRASTVFEESVPQAVARRPSEQVKRRSLSLEILNLRNYEKKSSVAPPVSLRDLFRPGLASRRRCVGAKPREKPREKKLP